MGEHKLDILFPSDFAGDIEHGDGDDEELDYMQYTITCVDNGYVVESVEDHKVFVKKEQVLDFLNKKL